MLTKKNYTSIKQEGGGGGVILHAEKLFIKRMYGKAEKMYILPNIDQ